MASVEKGRDLSLQKPFLNYMTLELLVETLLI